MYASTVIPTIAAKTITSTRIRPTDTLAACFSGGLTASTSSYLGDLASSPYGSRGDCGRAKSAFGVPRDA